MLIAHISDFHLFADQPETEPVRRDIETIARRVVDGLARFTPKLDAIAFTGDLTDGGSIADYELLKDVLSPLDMPVLMVPGNHDKRANLRAAFRDRFDFGDREFLNYETDIGGFRILALDTLVEGRISGGLAQQSLAWLAEKLDRVTDRPTLILLHHPPFPSGMASLDRNALVGGRAEMARLVADHSGALVILAGHIHRPFNGIWNGAYCAVGGSPAFQVALDLTATDHEPACIAQPYCYFVHRIDADATMAVNACHIQI